MVFMRFRPQLIFSSLCTSPKPRTSPPPATLAAARRRSHTTPAAVTMATPPEDALRRALAERQAAVDAQAEAVRALKAGGAVSKADVDAAVEALKALKVEAGAAARRLQQSVGAGPGGAAREEMRQAVVNTLERKLFYIPSFKIHRGVAGLYDYGPPGCRVKANVLSFWRQVMPRDSS
jgi:glycyl-tRNA synthetase